MRQRAKITGGVYLVLDPSMERVALLRKLEEALAAGVSVLQVWNNWPPSCSLAEKRELVQAICPVASAHGVPVLVNEEWELLRGTGLAGVHFDGIPDNYAAIRAEVNRDFSCGITCSNNLEAVRWADENGLDYISFCAMFPSASAGSCELVRPETVRQARLLTQLPFFVSGGITAANLGRLQDLDIAGVAVISGILNAPSPKEATAAYLQTLNKFYI